MQITLFNVAGNRISSEVMRSALFHQIHNSGIHVMTKMTYISIQHACSTVHKLFRQAAIIDSCQNREVYSMALQLWLTSWHC
jgi:hypothetical protein